MPGETNVACVLTRLRVLQRDSISFSQCPERQDVLPFQRGKPRLRGQELARDHTAHRGRAEANGQIRLIPKFTLFPALIAPNLQGFSISEAALNFHFFVKLLICPSFISLTPRNPSEYLPAGAPQGPLISEPA